MPDWQLLAEFTGALSKEGLNNSILEFSDHENKKCHFLFSSFSMAYQPLKMAAHPCAAETLS